MASIVKRGLKYVARYRDAAGNRRSVATGCDTRKTAQRFADDLKRKAERQRQGLEPLHQEGAPMTFGELYEFWRTQYGVHLRGNIDSFLKKRLVNQLDKLPLQEVSSAKLEGLLQSHAKELSEKSLNELRGFVHTLFRRATQRGLWFGLNPAAAVEKRKVQRKLFDMLRAEEVPRLLAALKPREQSARPGASPRSPTFDWRPVFATAVYTGMRKGELLGLRKTDVDMVAGTIAVRRSYDNETTKGGPTWSRSRRRCGPTSRRRCSARAGRMCSLGRTGRCARAGRSCARCWRVR
jgi:integrase